MDLRALAILFIVLSQVASGQDLKWEPRIRDDGIAVIISSREGHVSLNEAIGSIPKDVWIKYVRVSFLSQHEELQKDINSYMAQNYPAELEAALASSGNMHNPKIIALRKAFTEAILASSYVKMVNEEFADRCEKITSVSYEKFFISKTTEKPEYEAMLWLTTEKCT